MEELRKIAEAYWKVASKDIKEAAEDFFRAMDRNGDKKVSLNEFLEVMKQEPYQDLRISLDLFKKLCREKNDLEFMDVMTLYYIIRSGRPFCDACAEFIPDIYFCCIECLHSSSKMNYCLCFKCFRDGKYSVHLHNQFVDNFTLLNEKRRQLLEPPSRAAKKIWKSNGKHNAPSSQAVVPAGAAVTGKRKRDMALEASGQALAFASLVATIATTSTCTIL
ncbi:hypothetical protein DITRI_Ditri08aG0024200 [Diplodiscus trichospermus]